MRRETGGKQNEERGEKETESILRPSPCPRDSSDPRSLAAWGEETVMQMTRSTVKNYDDEMRNESCFPVFYLRVLVFFSIEAVFSGNEDEKKHIPRRIKKTSLPFENNEEEKKLWKDMQFLNAHHTITLLFLIDYTMFLYIPYIAIDENEMQ